MSNYLSGGPLTPPAPAAANPDDEPIRPRFYPVEIDGRRVNMTPEQYDAWQEEKAEAIAAARARADARDAAAAKARDDARTAHQEAIAGAEEEAAKSTARAVFGGTDAEFTRAWPELWRRMRIERVIDAERRRQTEIAKMASHF